MKSVQIIISERFYTRGDKIFQHFVYDKTFDKLLKDNRYTAYEMFETKIKEKSLNCHFIKRREETGKVIFEYELPEETKKYENSYFTIFSYVPPSPGCDYCQYARKNKASFIWCEYKQQAISSKIRRCNFFLQKK